MPNAGGIVLNAEVLANHLGHTLQGPQFAGITVFAGPFQQQAGQLLTMPSRQLGLGTRMWLGLQSRWSVPLIPLLPLTAVVTAGILWSFDRDVLGSKKSYVRGVGIACALAMFL